MAAVKTRNTATLMTEGSIVKSLLLFALPLIFGNLLQQMYNTADSIIVGNFVGSNALAAVVNTVPLFLFLHLYSTACRFFKEISRIGAECVNAPLEI